MKDGWMIGWLKGLLVQVMERVTKSSVLKVY